MYKEYLGEGYHDKIRKMLTVDDNLLPDRIIDADLNIGGMKQLMTPAIDRMTALGKAIKSEDEYSKLSEVAIHYLCGILCMALKSRTSTPPFNVPKYKKNWSKKQKKHMDRGNILMQGLINNVGKLGL